MTKYETILSLISCLEGVIGEAMKHYLINHYMILTPEEFVTAYNNVSKYGKIEYLGGNMYNVKFN